MKREVICDDCGEKFIVDVGVKKKRRERLCEKCWRQKRTGPLSEKHRKQSGNGNRYREIKINTKSIHTSTGGKQLRRTLKKALEEIEKKDEIIDSLSRDNIKLKEELKIRGIRY